MSELWEINQEWASEFLLEMRDPEGWYRAAVRYDGCIDLYRYFNTPVGLDPENDKLADSIHVCDIDDFIARLQALKREAHKHFGNNEHWRKPDIVEGTLQPVPLQIEQEANKHE